MILRWARLAVSVALIALASGAPRTVLAAIWALECCGDPCGGEHEGKGCPPNCSHGDCVKILRFIAAAPMTFDRAALEGVESNPLSDAAPVLPLVVQGLFHPPRG